MNKSLIPASATPLETVARTIGIEEIPWNVAVLEASKVLVPELQADTPAKYIESREGPGGRMLDYTPWPYAARKLTQVFGPTWSFTLVDKPQIIDLPDIPAKGHRRDCSSKCTDRRHTQPTVQKEVIVCMRLTTPISPVGHEGFGEAKYYPNSNDASLGNALQAAQSIALRRLAARLGIGLDLYEKTEGQGADLIAEQSDRAKAKANWKATLGSLGITELQAIKLLSAALADGDEDALPSLKDCLTATGYEGPAAYDSLAATLLATHDAIYTTVRGE